MSARHPVGLEEFPPRGPRAASCAVPPLPARGPAIRGCDVRLCGRPPTVEAYEKGRGSSRTPAPHRRPSPRYGVTLPIFTLAVPAVVPRAFTSWTRPKNSRPAGASASAVTWPVTVAEAPVARCTGA